MIVDFNKQTFKDVLRIANMTKLHQQIVVENLLMALFEAYTDDELINIIEGVDINDIE